MNLAQNPLIAPIGWTLLHFVWQGLLIAGLLVLALALLRHNSANARYLAGCMALGLMSLCPLVTFLIVRTSDATPLTPQQVTALEVFQKSAKVSLEPASPLSALLKHFEPYLPALVLTWSLGMLILAVRMVGGLIQVERLRRRDSKPADGIWQARLEAIASRLQIRKTVRLLVCDRIDVPSAMGFLKATVLIPSSVLMRLSTQELEALLAHELAHIRRHDYLVNLLQTAVETTLFYHPAVWWTSRVIRAEREHCCDDIAIDALGDPVQYARALASLEEQRSLRPALTLGATGGSLMQRIRRILGLSSADSKMSLAWAPCLALVALLLPLGAFSQGSKVAEKKVAGPEMSIDVQDVAQTKRSFRRALDQVMSNPDAVINVDGERHKVRDLTPAQKERLRMKLDEAAEDMTFAMAEAGRAAKDALKEVFAEDGPVSQSIRSAMVMVGSMRFMDADQAGKVRDEVRKAAQEARRDALESLRDRRLGKDEARQGLEEARKALRSAAEEMRHAREEALRKGEKDPTQIDVHLDIAKILEDVSKGLEDVKLDGIPFDGEDLPGMSKKQREEFRKQMEGLREGLKDVPGMSREQREEFRKQMSELRESLKDLPDSKTFRQNRNWTPEGFKPFENFQMPDFHFDGNGMTPKQREQFRKEMRQMREQLKKQMKELHEKLKDLPQPPSFNFGDPPEPGPAPKAPPAPPAPPAGPQGVGLPPEPPL